MRRALGKGLSQLLAEEATSDPTSVSVDVLQPNSRQPRRQFDQAALQELANSVKEHGVLLPLIVRPLTDGKYELIAGERRLRASKLAGLREVPVIVRAADAQASLEMALIENVQREDISAMECAYAYKRLADEFGLSQEQVADKVGKSRTAIANTLRLLKLPGEVQDAVADGSISEGHARAILQAEGELRQVALFEKIVTEGLSVREAEALARTSQVSAPKTTQHKPETAADPNLKALEDRLSQSLGSPVRLKMNGNKGKLVVDLYSEDDLQRILDILEISL